MVERFNDIGNTDSNEEKYDQVAESFKVDIQEVSKLLQLQETQIKALQDDFSEEYEDLKDTILMETIPLEVGVAKIFDLFYEVMDRDFKLYFPQLLEGSDSPGQAVKEIFEALDDKKLVYDSIILALKTESSEVNYLGDFLRFISIVDAKEFIKYCFEFGQLNHQAKTKLLRRVVDNDNWGIHGLDESVKELINYTFEQLLNDTNPYFRQFIGLLPDGEIAEFGYVDLQKVKRVGDLSISDYEWTPKPYSEPIPERLKSALKAVASVPSPLKDFIMDRYTERLDKIKGVSDKLRLKVLLYIFKELDGIYKHDRVAGQGGIMQHLVAFKTAAQFVKAPEGANELDVLYPASGPHIGVLEFVNGLIESNGNLKSINLTMTELKDFTPFILNFLKQFKEKGLITDLDQNWSREYMPGFASGNTVIDEVICSRSQISFKIKGVKVNLTYDFGTHGDGGFWAGKENLDKSDVVLIHDLDGSERSQLNACFKSVSDGKGDKIVIINQTMMYTVPDKLKVEEIYANPYANFGCNCGGIASHGVKVLRVSKRDE